MKTDSDIFEIYAGQRGIGSEKSLFTSGFLELPHNKRILEIGFGQGELARYMIEHGNAFYGIDVGLASIEGAIKDNFIDKGCFLYMDVSKDKLPFIDNFFDQSYMLETIEHLASPLHAVYEVKRVLKHDGQFIIQFPMYETQGYNAGNHAHVYPGLLAKEPFERFMMQLYFKKEKRIENGASAIYVYTNKKEDKSLAPQSFGEHQPNVFVVAQGNYNEAELYGHLNVDWLPNLAKMQKKEIKEGQKEIHCVPCNREITPLRIYENEIEEVGTCMTCSRMLWWKKK